MTVAQQPSLPAADLRLWNITNGSWRRITARNLILIAIFYSIPMQSSTVLFRNADLTAKHTSTYLHAYTSVTRVSYLHCRRGARTEPDSPAQCITEGSTTQAGGTNLPGYLQLGSYCIMQICRLLHTEENRSQLFKETKVELGIKTNVPYPSIHPSKRKGYCRGLNKHPRGVIKNTKSASLPARKLCSRPQACRLKWPHQP